MKKDRTPLMEYNLDNHIAKERAFIRALEVQKVGAEAVLARLLEKKEQIKSEGAS